MNKMTKILLGILGVSLVPLAMLGAMLYFGRTADEPASGTIDLGSATTGYAGTEYAESDYAATTETNENVSDTESDGADSDTGSNAAIIDNVNFYASDIPDKIWKNMQGKSYPKDCTVEKKDLSYVHVLYVDFGGRTCEGELIVNKIISQDIVEIFWELYQAQYPFHSQVFHHFTHFAHSLRIFLQIPGLFGKDLKIHIIGTDTVEVVHQLANVRVITIFTVYIQD